jgi:hypothetical protein
MKKMIALIATMVLGLTVAVSAPASASTPSYTKKDYMFVKLVRAQAPYFKYSPMKLMVKSARLTCELLDTGYDETDAAFDMMDTGFTQKQAIVFVSSAMTVYCPWHGDDIRSGL